MKILSQWLTGTLFLVGLMSADSVQGQVSCNASQVSVNNTSIEVQPTGGDDTANIQCAFDAAIDADIPVIVLEQGSFSISQVEASGFNGTLEGITRASTIVNIFIDFDSCAASLDNGRLPAGFRFIGGSARVRFMTINVGANCDGAIINTAVQFTGQPSSEDDCDNDVVFGEVDRVDLIGPGLESSSRAVAASPEALIFGGCNDVLSGTLKLNRSSVQGFNRGVLTSMRAQSPVDIRFNDFSDVKAAVYVINANQDTTVAANDFQLNDIENGRVTGVAVLNDDIRPPAINAMRLLNNNFDIELEGTGYFFDSFPRRVNIVTSIANNQFTFADGATGAAISTLGADGGVITGNSFDIGALDGFRVRDEALSGNTVGWSVVDNQFNGATVNLGPDTAGFIVGPGQDAVVNDQGTGNFVLTE